MDAEARVNDEDPDGEDVDDEDSDMDADNEVDNENGGDSAFASVENGEMDETDKDKDEVVYQDIVNDKSPLIFSASVTGSHALLAYASGASACELPLTISVAPSC